MAATYLSLYIILLTCPYVWSNDSIEPPYEAQMNSHDESKQIEETGTKQRQANGLNYFLGPQRSIASPSSSPSSSSSSSTSSSLNEERFPDENSNNNEFLLDPESIEKRAFVPLRGRKDVPENRFNFDLDNSYGYYSPGYNAFNSIYPGYRKKAAFTGMRGKKEDPLASGSAIKKIRFRSENRLNNKPIYVRLPWLNLNELNGFKRSRPFAAMRG